VKLTVFDLQQDPSNPGLKFHRIENAKDPNFWSVRVNRDIRLIVHKTASSFLIAYVDHHDAAYRWAERRRIDTHPRTGAAQLVEIRERVETIFGPAFVDGPTSTLPPPMAEAAEEDQDPYYPPLFLQLTEEDLLGIGVPEDWLRDVHNASENNFLDLADHIPAEAMEALLGYVADGVLRPPEQQLPGIDPFSHPDALRRFRVMDNVAALENALNAPWDRWAIFLHPDQEKLVEAPASGPVRIAGSAGTGKTVVALHRTSHLLRTAPASKLLLTSFSSPLCNALRQKLRLLVGNDQILTDRVSIAPFDGAAQQLFTLIKGYEPRLVSPETVRSTLLQAAEAQGLQGFTDRFLLSEWRHVVDAWQIESLEAYARVPRLGRKNRLGSKQRERLWPVFAEVRERLQAQ
ncbi:MAG: UvrD-helicase domain-containing protein, partial [Rhodospirillaceae bacterium]